MLTLEVCTRRQCQHRLASPAARAASNSTGRLAYPAAHAALSILCAPAEQEDPPAALCECQQAGCLMLPPDSPHAAQWA